MTLQRELSVMPMATNWMTVGSIQSRSLTDLSLLPHTQRIWIPFVLTGVTCPHSYLQT